MSLLSARDLWIAPPGAPDPVVRGLSLELEAGEWVAITGPNGGGKTSLALALAGLWPIRSGSIELAGKAFGYGRFGDSDRSAVAVVMQEPGSQLLQPTVAEEIEFAARNLDRPPGEIAADAACWISALDLAADLTRDPHTLAAGRQQMVLLAAALVARPRVLIADEAAAHLDSAARAQVLEVLARKVARGLAVVWVTQDEAEAAAASRRVTVGEAPAVPRARHALIPSAGVALRIRVGPWEGGEGPRVTAGTGLEIDVPDRGIVALLGPNGSGKSVLLGAAVGLEPAGQVSVEWTRPPQPPAIAALQYPENQLFEEVVADEVAFAATRRGVGRVESLEKASACFARLGLGGVGFLSRRTWSLSTGEKRLLEVVGALIAPACLVGLDEPTAGLDAARREALAALVAERASSMPVLVATQDTGWVRELGAREIRLGQPTPPGSAKSQ